MPALLEFSPYFREQILGTYASKFDEGLEKSGILLYLAIAVAIIGVGVLSFISAMLSFGGAAALLIYNYKYKIFEKLGMNYNAPKLEEL